MSKSKDQNFSKLMKELEDIVAWFEKDDIDLDESLAKFERGVEISELLKSRLKDTENKVKKIQSKLDT